MKFEIRDKGDWAHIWTKGLITKAERKNIISALKERGLNRPLAGILVDHREASFQDKSLCELECGRQLAEINLKDEGAGIFVIASSLNRASIDMVAMAAHKAGVPIKVCISQEEAILKIACSQKETPADATRSAFPSFGTSDH